jgi:uncharacterized RDD family membrane protein YckC
MRSNRQDVSGNYAGAVTRLLAHSIDIAIAGLLFVAALVALDYVLRTVAGIEAPTDDRGPWYAVAAGLWFFGYWWALIAIAGKTIGKAVLGLRVVSREGDILSSSRAALRAIALPLSYLLFGFGFLGIIVGRERRALHDVVAGSAVVYDWGPRTAELPLPISAYLARRSSDATTAAADEPAE